MLRLRENVSSKSPTTVAKDCIYSQDKLVDFNKTNWKNTLLKEKLNVAADLLVGLNRPQHVYKAQDPSACSDLSCQTPLRHSDNG